MKTIKKSFLRNLFITLVLDVLFFGLTNPGKLLSVWLIAGFILVVTTVYWLIRGGMAFLSIYVKPLKRRQKRIVRVLTATLAILIAMQSIGQLSLRDLIVLVLLAIILYFYLTYGRNKEQQS